MKKISFLVWLLPLVIISRVSLLYLNTHSNPAYNIQQDNYATYAYALKHGLLDQNFLTPFDTRLFPGYPFLIVLLTSVLPVSEVIAGVIISVVSSLLAVYFFWLWSRHQLASIVFAVFPPIWVQVGSKVATEPLMLALSLGSILLFHRKFFWLAGLVLGYAFIVRNVAAFLFLALLVSSWKKETRYNLLQFASGFILFPCVLVIFNIIYLDHPLHQIVVYGSNIQAKIGFLAFFQNIERTLSWGQHRILISGVTYVLVTVMGFILLVRKYRLYRRPPYEVAFWWGLFSLFFVFALSYDTFLEDFGRYAVPFLPATLLGLIPNYERTTPPKRSKKRRSSTTN